MQDTITIPAGTRVFNVGANKTETLEKTLVVEATYRIVDDTWVFFDELFRLYEVKLNPGD